MPFRKLPPLHALAAFEAVARHLSFSRAARELCLTHSAVSQRVRLLEDMLKTQFFVRSNRSVELTSAGQRYLEAVREALSKLQLASENFSKSRRKLLRLSVAIAFASNWLIYRMQEFYDLHPAVDLDIQSSNELANVKVGEVDIAIRWGIGDWPGLEKIRLISDELFPVCSRKYLDRIGKPETPADLRNAVLLRHSLQLWKPWFDRAGLDWPEPAQGPCFNDSALMLQAAADGLGVALTRRIFVEHLLESGALIRLFDIAARVEQSFYVVYLKESLRREEVAGFVNWIVAAAGKARQ